MLLPAIDQNVCGQWIEQDVNLYNKLPVWFLAAEAEYRKYYATFQKVLTGRFPWKAMSGDLLRTIIPEPTPVLRQFTFPVKIAAGLPLADVINYVERTTDSAPAWQDFLSPTFYFKPEFSDFMTHVDRTKDNIMEQITVFEDQFYRTFLWSKSPSIYIAGVGLVDAPTAEINTTGDAAGSKTTAWLQAQIALLMGAESGYLDMAEVFRVLNEAENTVGMTPYEGSTIPKDGAPNPLSEKYCLIGGGEVWNNWVLDPWVTANRSLNMNIVTEGFKGDLWGRATTKIERFPLRFQIDGNYTPTQAAPQTREVDPAREDYNRTKPNPLYSRINIAGQSGTTGGSPIAVAWLVGGPNVDIMDVGPPPSAFTQSLNGVVGMNWNGKVYMNKNIAVPCKTTAGDTFIDVNSFGRYLRLQGTTTVGARATNIQNVLPILYKRKVGPVVA